MSKFALLFLGITIVASSFILGGGAYRTDQIRAGVAHQTNIFTGEISLCTMDEGCKKFSEKSITKTMQSSQSNTANQAIYTISYIRANFPQYADLTDGEIAEKMYRNYSEINTSPATKDAFNKVIGYAAE